MQENIIQNSISYISKNPYLIYLFVISASVLATLALSNLYKDDKKEISFADEDTLRNIAVDISGAVKAPGVYILEEGARVSDLVKEAKGYSKDANVEWITKNTNLAALLGDAQKVYVPFEWENVKDVVTDVSTLQWIADSSGDSSRASASTEYAQSSASSASSNPSNLSSSSSSMSPNVTNSSNSNLEDSNTDTYDNLPEDAKINSTTNGSASGKVNINSASQDDLEGLTGIGPKYAERIIANRPYNNIQDIADKAKIPSSVLGKISSQIIF